MDGRGRQDASNCKTEIFSIPPPKHLSIREPIRRPLHPSFPLELPAARLNSALSLFRQSYSWGRHELHHAWEQRGQCQSMWCKVEGGRGLAGWPDRRRCRAALRVNVMTAAPRQKAKFIQHVRGCRRRGGRGVGCATLQKSVDAPFNYRHGRPRPPARPVGKRKPKPIPGLSKQIATPLPSFLLFRLLFSSPASPFLRAPVCPILPSFIKGEVIPSPKLFLRPPKLVLRPSQHRVIGSVRVHVRPRK